MLEECKGIWRFFCDKWFFHIGDGVESCRRPRTSSRYRRFFFLRYISYSSTTVLNVKLSANSNMPVAIPNILPRLPRWISHWLGYRPTPPKPHPQYLVWLWSFFTAFCGLCVLQAIFNYSSYFLQRGVPGIVASFVSTKMFFFLVSFQLCSNIWSSVRVNGREGRDQHSRRTAIDLIAI